MTTVYRKALLSILIICVLSGAVFAVDRSDPIIDKAKSVFGDPLNAEHRVFSLNNDYAIWLISQSSGNLSEVVVGPKSYDHSEFPNTKTPPSPEFLSDEEYEDALRRISEIKNIGVLKKAHGPAVWSRSGAFSTDHFENASVDRIVGDAPAELQNEPQHVRRFNLYFFTDVAGAPKEVSAVLDNPMVCLGNEWYYLQLGDPKQIPLGKWQTLSAAGPNMYSTVCTRTTPLYDADGFTIEEFVNETIVTNSPYSVRALIGRVHAGGSPLEEVHVEVKREGSHEVLRTKTNDEGAFRFPGVPEGKYKFKVTKRASKALTGTIIVDRHAAK